MSTATACAGWMSVTRSPTASGCTCSPAMTRTPSSAAAHRGRDARRPRPRRRRSVLPVQVRHDSSTTAWARRLRRGWRRVALALLALALVARVAAVAATPGYVPHHDDRDFDRIACWVAEHGLPPDRSPRLPPRGTCVTHGPPGRRTAYRPPLWPLVLGASDVVARAVGIQRWTAGRLAQAVIGTAVAGLVGLIAAELYGGAVGLVALGLAAVFLPLILDG